MAATVSRLVTRASEEKYLLVYLIDNLKEFKATKSVYDLDFKRQQTQAVQRDKENPPGLYLPPCSLEIRRALGVWALLTFPAHSPGWLLMNSQYHVVI